MRASEFITERIVTADFEKAVEQIVNDHFDRILTKFQKDKSSDNREWKELAFNALASSLTKLYRKRLLSNIKHNTRQVYSNNISSFIKDRAVVYVVDPTDSGEGDRDDTGYLYQNIIFKDNKNNEGKQLDIRNSVLMIVIHHPQFAWDIENNLSTTEIIDLINSNRDDWARYIVNVFRHEYIHSIQALNSKGLLDDRSNSSIQPLNKSDILTKEKIDYLTKGVEISAIAADEAKDLVHKYGSAEEAIKELHNYMKYPDANTEFIGDTEMYNNFKEYGDEGLKVWKKFVKEIYLNLQQYK